jgi:four helix bundle protein
MSRGLQVTGYELQVRGLIINQLRKKEMRAKSYKDLEVYQMAYRLALEVHQMTMKLPKYELYEQGSQIRRSSKRIKDTIAEGYGRRRYKDEFIRYLIFAHSSNDEVLSQLEMINDLHFEGMGLNKMINEYRLLSKKTNRFLNYVENNWLTNKPHTM